MDFYTRLATQLGMTEHRKCGMLLCSQRCLDTACHCIVNSVYHTDIKHLGKLNLLTNALYTDYHINKKIILRKMLFCTMVSLTLAAECRTKS